MEINCPICGIEVSSHKVFNNGEMWKIKCPRCGNYKVTDSAKDMVLESLSKNKKIRLSIIIRNSNLRNRDLFEIDTENIKEIIDTYVKLTVPEKIDKLQINLSKMVNNPNDVISVSDSIDWPIAYAEDETELTYYLEYLQENGLVRFSNKSSGTADFVITVQGWRSISELQKNISTSNNAFVAMNFDDEFDELYEKYIKEAITACGFQSIRSDKVEHVDLIDDKIIADIKESRFVVAEFTGQKHGVYFEAGYARGLGLPVIWVCKKDDLKNLHFDTNHYNQIDWETPEELKKRLYDRIRAVI